MTGPDDLTARLGPGLEEVLQVVREHRDRHDGDATFPVEPLEALRRTGLLGLAVPHRLGGPGGSLRQILDVGERIGREDLSVALIFVMHCQQVAALVRHATGRLREDLLPRVARGEVYLASVTTERGTGGHLLTSESALESDDEGLLWIDRDAPVVTGAGYADGFLVTMLAPGAAAPTEVSLVYADRGQLEVKAAGEWQPLGMRASQSLPVRLLGSVPADQIVGEHGGFRAIASDVFGPMAHLGWSACWLGAAAGALSRTVHHLRSAEGRAKTGSELTLARLARVRSRLESVHALIEHGRAVYESAEDVSLPRVQSLLNTVKVHSAEQTFTAATELVELLGLRHGYMRDSPLWIERTLRDLRSASLNYSNDRLLLANGRLALLDAEVHLA